MPKVRKEIWILFFVAAAVLTGCSAARRVTAGSSEQPVIASGTFLYRHVAENNVANDGVFIRRIRLESSIEGNRNRFTANLRKSAEGEWLISVRSLLGIEVARIFADANGVTLLDRLAGTADIYSWERLTREFGVNHDMLPLLLGDIPQIVELEENKIECGQPIRIAGRTGPAWMITIDCETGKPKEIIVTEPVYNRQVTFHVLQVLNRDNRFLPYEIAVTEGTGVLQVRYTMEDIEVNWSGNITFSIPQNYRINR